MLSEKEKNAIAYAILKALLKKEAHFDELDFREIPEIERETDDLARKTGIGEKEIREVINTVLKEISEEEMATVDE